jgi:hypothetical protein
MFVSMFSFHSLSPSCPVLRFGSLHRYMRSTFCVPIRRSFAWWILLFCHFGQSCDVVHYARHVNAFTLSCFHVCPVAHSLSTALMYFRSLLSTCFPLELILSLLSTYGPFSFVLLPAPTMTITERPSPFTLSSAALFSRRLCSFLNFSACFPLRSPGLIFSCDEKSRIFFPGIENSFCELRTVAFRRFHVRFSRYSRPSGE